MLKSLLGIINKLPTSISSRLPTPISDKSSNPKFSPYDTLPNCRAWFSPRYTDMISESGGLVSSYTNKIGTTSIAQATGSKQPTTYSRTIGDKNVFDFNSADSESLFGDVVASGFSGTSVQFSLYAVIQMDNAGTTRNIISLESSSSSNPLIIIRVDSANRLQVLRRDNAGNIKTSTNTNVIDYNPHIVNCVFDGTNVKIYIDGTLINTADLSTSVGAMTLDRLRIGSFRDSAANYFDGGLGDIIISYGADSDTVRQKIEGYLAWEYGLVYSLPYNHPYWDGRIFGKPYLFNPSQLGALWLSDVDASDLSTLTTSAGAVSQINNKVAGKPNYSQATGANQPTAFTRSQNNRNGLDFDGTNDVLGDTGTVITGNPNLAIIEVGIADTNSIAQRIGTLGNASASFGFVGMTYGSGGDVSRFNGGSESYQSPSILASAFIGCLLRPSGGNINDTTFRRNGTLQSSTASSSGTSIPNLLAGDAIGGYMSTSTKIAGFDGVLFQRIIVESNSQSVYEKIEGFLAHKWGLTANLDSSHPYKNTPPKA